MIQLFTPVFSGVFLVMMFFWLFCIAFFVGGFILWIFMLIDVIKRKFSKDDDKILWVLVIVLAGIVGAVIYYFVVKRKEKKRK